MSGAATVQLGSAGERFRANLWRSSGTAYLLPVNIKDPVLRSLAGEGTALARQIELTAWRVLHADRRSDDPAGPAVPLGFGRPNWR
ncbi:hypothetical protein [Streptomyces sp. NPDC006334]|uniref:hypothetical protein n=1 Tax=Streptomyces sp. NPDC006334 TaxID=3156754 RepID=UPI0033B2236B